MTIKLEIEKGIPTPDPKVKRAGIPNKYRYPYRDMEVGDSFLVPGALVSEIASVRSYAAQTTGYRFAARAVEGGVRVWRVK